MMKHTLMMIVAALAIAGASSVSASTGGALACPTGLGENCTAPGVEASESLTPLPAPPAPVQFAAGNCGSAAAAAAAAQGGQVIGAPQAVQQGGQTVCVVTVLIKDPTGQRPPTRRQVTVPAN
jgi:hypothetical protein